jgi:Peptidase_C39 like family
LSIAISGNTGKELALFTRYLEYAMVQITSRFLPQLIINHQFQGRTNNCGPCCAAITINTIKGTQLSGEKLADELNRPKFTSGFPFIRRIPNWATFPWGITSLFHDFGIAGKTTILSSDSVILASIIQGKIPIVVLGDYHPLWAHYIIIGAYSSQSGWGVIDPAINLQKIWWMPFDYFYEKWSKAGKILILSIP